LAHHRVPNIGNILAPRRLVWYCAASSDYDSNPDYESNHRSESCSAVNLNPNPNPRVQPLTQGLSLTPNLTLTGGSRSGHMTSHPGDPTTLAVSSNTNQMTSHPGVETNLQILNMSSRIRNPYRREITVTPQNVRNFNEDSGVVLSTTPNDNAMPAASATSNTLITRAPIRNPYKKSK
jgi:hypothetical protein